MSKPELAPEVDHFYSQVIDENARLAMSADGRLELLRTQELLRRFLPSSPARILDVGGGPGAHARWLVADGYQVELIDPVARHVDQAAAVCPATIGDARRLTAADASYDVVQLLGPLYHLPDPDDRKKALAEAHRVVRPGGLVAAAAINRYSSIFEHVTYAHLHKERIEASISTILSTAVHDGKRGFTLAYFHRAEELVEEMRSVGLTDVQVFGVEGPAWSLLKAVEQQSEAGPSDDMFASVLTAARLAEPYPELLAASSHLLAVGRAPEGRAAR
ncbi:class I SAM-dependent methyltransferase [Streptomyces sp. AC536]|uniref:class I SAM-dependent methyltransferase n=1 Tax=Streptomyces buecherae TaxID=2763006 RepID=UPI00164D2627|nr:class I SAM-dependent methyltransferase [Streptomyces buecherae]MBC3982758.1 class I SAM-dependent methyltransferase [Streptomyces buecherae]QNJ41325.1 class I SAM-dependent methyltransferase [Streptomyces buecherae]